MSLFSLILRPLEAARFDYMISGSVAAMAYGQPRLTNDIDLILAISSDSISKLEAAFPEIDFYRAPSEVLQTEAARAQRGHTNIIHHETGFRADIYFRANDPLHRWAWPRRQRFEVDEGLEAWFAPPEYVVLRKLEYYREGGSEKHLNDIRAMLEQPESETLRCSPDMRDWSAALGVAEVWARFAQ